MRFDGIFWLSINIPIKSELRTRISAQVSSPTLYPFSWLPPRETVTSEIVRDKITTICRAKITGITLIAILWQSLYLHRYYELNVTKNVMIG